MTHIYAIYHIHCGHFYCGGKDKNTAIMYIKIPNGINYDR